MSIIYIVTKNYHDYEGSSTENLCAFIDEQKAIKYVKAMDVYQTQRLQFAKLLQQITNKWWIDNPRPTAPIHSIPLSQKELGKLSRANRQKYTARIQKEIKRAQSWLNETRDYADRQRDYLREQLFVNAAPLMVINEFNNNNGYLSQEKYQYSVEPVELE